MQKDIFFSLEICVSNSREAFFRKEFALYFRGLKAHLTGDHATLRRVCSSEDLSQDQRKLLLVRRLHRKRKWATASNLLQSVTTFSHPFFEAEQHFLMASSFSYVSEWEWSFAENLKALEIYEAESYYRGCFLASYNLAAAMTNTGRFNDAGKWLKRAEIFSESPSEKVMIRRLQACELSGLGQFDQAVGCLEQALELVDQLSAIEKANLYLVAFDIYCRAGNFERCEIFYNKIRRTKLLRYGARALFECYLYDIYRQKIKVSWPRHAVVEDHLEYGPKWRLVAYVLEGNLELAQNVWSQLHRAFPDLYEAAFLTFSQSEAVSLFGRVLRQITLKKTAGQVPVLTGQLADLYSLLITAPMGLRKEYLIEKIWRKSYDPALDDRFYQLVRRLNVKLRSLNSRDVPGQESVRSRNGAYSLAAKALTSRLSFGDR